MLVRLLPLLLLFALALPAQAQGQAPAQKGEEVFAVVDHPPELIGGLQGLAQQVHYPAVAEASGTEGTVLIQFVVDERGAVTNAKVVRGVSPELDAEALRVVRGAAFRPGSHDGKPAKVRFVLPVKFVLDVDQADQ